MPFSGWPFFARPPPIPHTPSSTPTSKPPGDIVFRVTSIPLGTTLSDLHSTLSEFTNLVPSCTTLCASSDSRSLTALIHFSPCPPPTLAALPRGDVRPVQLRLGTKSHDIAIDRDFYGLTQLYEPHETIKADIVAVSGLNGHPYGSWTSHPEDKGQRKMWLRHFLDEDMPGCRTMIYGYDSSLSPDSRGIHRIPDYTDEFLKALKNSRKSAEEKERPLIFIGHSFGGIIISQALVRAKESERIYGSLFRCTRATIFFGTPHRGLSVDDILIMIGEDSSRNDLVNSLQTGSRELEAELRRFINNAADAKIKIVSFKETEQSRKLKKGSNGGWSRSGDHFIAVERGSAVLQLPETLEETLPATGDHSTMVKFKYKAHTTYKNVIEYLEEYAHPCPYLESSHGPITAYKAVMERNASGLRLALQQPRVDVNEQQTGRATFLHLAISNDDKECTGVLLSHGAKTEAKNPKDETPLLLAVREGRAWAVVMLLDNGAHITASCEGLTAMHLAAQTGNEEIVRLLRDKGMDINARAGDEDGYRPLHFAAQAGHVQLVKVLLELGADVTATGYDSDTPLHTAAISGQKQVVALLLQQKGLGLGVKAKDREGCTPLHVAAFGGHTETLELLLKHASHEDWKAADGTGRTLLHHASAGGHADTVKMLLEMDGGVDLLRKTNYNMHTPLHIAAKNSKEKVVELLLERGADKMVKDKAGNTPRDLAVKQGYMRVVEALERCLGDGLESECKVEQYSGPRQLCYH